MHHSDSRLIISTSIGVVVIGKLMNISIIIIILDNDNADDGGGDGNVGDDNDRDGEILLGMSHYYYNCCNYQ